MATTDPALSSNGADSAPASPNEIDRRSFVRLATALTAVGTGVGVGGSVAAQGRGKQGRGKQERGRPRRSEPLPPPPNSLPPAMQFQAAPGGTGHYLQDPARAGQPPEYPSIEVASREDAPASDKDIAFLPLPHLAGLIRSKALSSTELTEIYLERLERLDPKLLCVVTLMKEQALAAAAEADREIKDGKYRGPLHGIPWGAKDLFATKGVPTTWGAKPFEDRIIDEDAEIVRRLRKAGAVLCAKLSLGTFARGDNWFRGRTRNPWNTSRGSSGSSAGPASATVAGLVGFGIGTETRGSIVSPATRCGMSALRPTFGRISRHGAMTLSWSMDKVGPMCRTIEGCALVFDALHGADPKDPSTVTAPFHFERKPDLSKLRIGYTRRADEGFLDKLRELGAEPVEVDNPPSSRGIGNVLGIESAAAFDDFLEKKMDEGMVHKGRADGFRRSSKATAVEYIHAQRRRHALMGEMAEWMKDLDLYVSRSGDVGLTNLTGHPAVVVPCAFDNGQPRVITLIGQLFADDKILSVAHAYQTATDWHERHPDLG